MSQPRERAAGRASRRPIRSAPCARSCVTPLKRGGARTDWPSRLLGLGSISRSRSHSRDRGGTGAVSESRSSGAGGGYCDPVSAARIRFRAFLGRGGSCTPIGKGFVHAAIADAASLRRTTAFGAKPANSRHFGRRLSAVLSFDVAWRCVSGQRRSGSLGGSETLLSASPRPAPRKVGCRQERSVLRCHRNTRPACLTLT